MSTGAASLTEQAMDTWGRLDAVVANAAIVRDRPFHEMTMADFDDLIDVNLRGTMRTVQPAYKAMRAGGGGRIVTVTSSSGMLGAHFQANYATSKAAMIGFTRAVALEGADHGIKANALAPGALGTRMHLAMVEAGGLNAESGADLVQNEAAAELMKPERVSPLITVLTHASCPVTGEVLCSWGGYYGRFGITTNRGWSERRDVATAEQLVEHWDSVMDESSARVAPLDSFAGGAKDAGKGSARLVTDALRQLPLEVAPDTFLVRANQHSLGGRCRPA